MQVYHSVVSTIQKCFVCIPVLLCITVPGLCAQAVPAMAVRSTAVAPVIDGELNDPAWAGAAKFGNFYLFSGEKPATEQTKAYMTYDNTNLYVAFICYDSHIAELKIDDTVFAGDDLEVFIDPGQGYNYTHIGINPKGKVRFAWQLGDRQNSVTTAVKTFADRWQVEIAVPWKDIKWATSGVVSDWGINLCRANPKAKEFSCWSPTITGFHNPSKFGIITGMKVDAKQFYLAQQPGEQVISGALLLSTDKTFYSTEKELAADIRVRFDGSLGGKKILLSVKDSQGKKLLESPVSQILLTNRKTINISPLPIGDYTITASLTEGNKTIGEDARWFQKIKPMAKPASKTEIKDGVFYLNGKPYMPIILYFGSDWGQAAKEIGVKDIRDAAAKGFNTIIPEYQFLKEDICGDKVLKLISEFSKNEGRVNFVRETNLTLGEILDAAIQNNLMVIPYIGFTWRTEKLDDEDRIKLGADIIQKYRNHPAVLCWHSNDETDGWTDLNQKVYKLYKELDPYRPAWLNLGNAVGANKDAADIISTDPYPIARANNTILRVVSHADTLKHFIGKNPSQTSWLVLQMFGSPREGWSRCPTPKEERCMTFLALNHGVKGLAYFIYQVESTRKSTGNKRLSEELWQYMAELNNQTKAMSMPYLLGKDVAGFTSSCKDLDIAAKEYEGHTYVIVCNTSTKDVNAEISAAGIKLPQKVEVLFEGRFADAKEASITDSFTGYDVHIYKL
jgi:hypothetical protein